MNLFLKNFFLIFFIVEFWTCLEISLQGDIFFIAGAQKNNQTPVIASITFDEMVEPIKIQKFESELEGFSCIRRHKTTNTLFVGAKSHILVLLWEEKTFKKISKFETFTDTFATDISSQKDSIYAVFGGIFEKGVAFHFGEPMKRERQVKKENRGRKRSGSRKKIPGYTVERKKRKQVSFDPIYQNRCESMELFREFGIKQISIPGGKIFFNFFFQRKTTENSGYC